MKRAILWAVVFVTAAFAQPPSFHGQFDLLQAPAAVFNDGLLGFVNPATVGLLQAPEVQLHGALNQGAGSMDERALFAAARGFGFGMLERRRGDVRTTDYQATAAFGDDRFAAGAGYVWRRSTCGDLAGEWKVGLIARPAAQLSFGVAGFLPRDGSKSALLEAGVRPFGNPRLTLFADAVVREGNGFSKDEWSAGAACRIVEGVSLVGRRFGDRSLSFGLMIDFGRSSLAGQTIAPEEGDGRRTFMVRAGGLRPSWSRKLMKNKACTSFELKGMVDYQKGGLFGGKRERFYPLLRDLRAAADDPRIAVIALNLTDLSIRPENAWELREELVRARRNGKQVLAFFENAEMTGYHLASAADCVVLDPLGTLFLPGLVMSRTYLKGTLEKLGLGFDEWRFFKYKSAYETYSRDQYSDADREQRQAFLDAWYEMIRRDVCDSRGFSPAAFDSLIDRSPLWTAEQAREARLVDRLGRWAELKEILKEKGKGRLIKIDRKQLEERVLVSDRWGGKEKIALVYGIGVCDMERGIRARRLTKIFERLTKDKQIKAIVFRVDSPGGSALASDIVAEAMKKCAQKKPVIVSQGQVAGSGGYWISMYGNKIVAGPNTITGSIGVIGGWVYDNGFSQKLGMSEDRVQRGEHADLEAGVTLPLIGLSVPHRNMTEEERTIIERSIRHWYDQFVTRVAEGRSMSKEAVHEAGQGRIYSGHDGKQVGLVDEIGGLMTAIAVACAEAGIKPGEAVEIVEKMPAPSLSEMFSAGAALSDGTVEFLRLTLQEQGRLLLLPPSDYPSFER